MGNASKLVVRGDPTPGARALRLGLAAATGLVGAQLGTALAGTQAGRRLLWPHVVGRVPTGRRELALTFDDGPEPRWTPAIAELLGEQAKATFFALGEASRRHPGVLRELVAAGHEVALHGETHRKHSRMGPREAAAEVDRGHQALVAAGIRPRWFRPPHGVLTASAWWRCHRLGMTPALWSGSSGDWQPGATAEEIAARALAQAAPGAVLLFHDAGGWPDRARATHEALPLVLRGLHERGLRPVTLMHLTTAGEEPA